MQITLAILAILLVAFTWVTMLMGFGLVAGISSIVSILVIAWLGFTL